MQYRQLANTDLEVSSVAFGCWAIIGGFTWGGHQDEKDSIEAMLAAYDAGVNFFDSAEMYGEGASEKLVGKTLRDIRDKVIVASKVIPEHYEPNELRTACDRSLELLGFDYIDLYQLHWPNHDIPVAETLGVMEELKQAGKVRAIGVSNYGPIDLAEVLEMDCTIVSNQLAYNLLFRAIEFEIKPICVREGLSVLCYSPMMQGLLTGKFATADDVPEDRSRTRHYSGDRPHAVHGGPGAEEEVFAAVAEIRRIADGLGQPRANVSLAWLLAQEGVAAVIAGGRSAEQARLNVAAADLTLPADALDALSKTTEPIKQRLGPNADMWRQDEENPRIR